ncbi:MAG: bifunctional phosphoribosylaminoimidazolecarboxamide formyltransferase/IMP cyclohydrolase, partial [Paraclostridium sp.]
NSFDAYKKCYEADKTSIFGGIVGFTSTVDAETAKKLNEIFLEIVVAYDFTEDAIEVLKQKKNLRVLKLSNIENSQQGFDLKYLDGKLLVQDRDEKLLNEYKSVTKKEANKEILNDMEFGMKIVKNMKSNAIAIVKNGQTLALGCGQTSRIWALKNALENNQDKNFEGAVLASDAFFPFDDCVTLASDYKIAGIIQPGGSMKDQDSIDACNKNDMVMVFTGIRHFKH